MKKTANNTFIAKMSSKGQVVIPEPMRKKAKWEKGDTLVVEVGYDADTEAPILILTALEKWRNPRDF